MPRADTGNFNRFLTSIGLLLLAAALLIPYFYFRDSETLHIPQAELRKLTPTAQQALERRQRRSADLEVPILALSILLTGGGIASLFFGGKRLRVAQGKEDEAIERQARREDYEIQQLSADEVEKKRDEQAREAVRESKAEEPEPEEQKPAPKPEVRQPPKPKIPAQVSRRPSGDVRYVQTREEIARIEEKTKLILERCESKRFRYFPESQVVGATAGRSLSMDGLFKSLISGRPDVIVELKISTRPSTMRMRAQTFSDRLLALLTRYREMTEREASGWLLVVVPERSDKLRSDKEQMRLEEYFELFLSGSGRCTIVREQDLDNELPARFRMMFDA